MKTKATKERKLLLSLVAVLVVSAFLAAPAAEATRYLPGTLAATRTLAPPNIADVDQVDAEAFWLFSETDVQLFSVLALFDASEIEQITAENRIRLFEDPGAIPRPVELAAIRKLVSGVLTCGEESNIWETGDLAQDCGSPSFQGLWTDPTTGIAYARNRWYDARNASWLSEDPLGAVDSVNLYAFVGWGPHMGRDPMGLSSVAEYNLTDRYGSQAYVRQANQQMDDYENRHLTDWHNVEQGALAYLAQSGVTDPLEQRGVLNEYATLRGVPSRLRPAFLALILGPVQQWEIEGKDASKGHLEALATAGRSADTAENMAIVVATIATLFADPSSAPRNLAATTQEKMVEGAMRVELTGGSVEGMALIGSRGGLVIDEYALLSKNRALLGQAHHLNQAAAFRDVVPPARGASIKLPGNIFMDAGAPHTSAHLSLESFWNLYRGTEFVPTNLHYTRALQESLRLAGLSENQVQVAIRAAIRERIRAGALGGMEVPRVPAAIRNMAE